MVAWKWQRCEINIGTYETEGIGFLATELDIHAFIVHI